MTSGILGALGGLGLFLIGMSVMTDGLKSLAGDALRRALARFTSSPLTGVATGMIGTAVLQSSSATTVMAVGFAGAGLLTFSQALGIIFGANIGTTITGWLVALLGFKLNLTQVVMPLVFVGAMMRLLGKRRVAASGYAVAGFGLIFTGISFLQLAMEGMSDVVTPDSFPPNTLYGRMLLVLIGVAITLVTQSSSAGVATAITAVHVGTMSLPQAAAMVIGMDMGTTSTAVMAAIGGKVNARRTGLAHVVYNLLTGLGAFVLLPLFIDGWDNFAPRFIRSDPEICLVSFHTLFNVLGLILVLPFTEQFARFIVWLVPSRAQELTRRLDPTLLDDPSIAIESVDATLRELAEVVFRSVVALLTMKPEGEEEPEVYDRLEAVEEAVEETRVYIGQIKAPVGKESVERRLVSAFHVVDHLSRLIRRCRVTQRLKHVTIDRELSAWSRQIVDALVTDAEPSERMTAFDTRLEPLWIEIDTRIEPYRRKTIQRAAAGKQTTDETLARLDAIRWLRRVCYHTWRIAHHLDPTVLAAPLQPSPAGIPEGEPEDLGLAPPGANEVERRDESN